jgi:hypothetical protein
MSAAWQLDATTARLIGSQISATIDLSQPARGLAVSVSDIAPKQFELQALGIEVGEEKTRSQSRLDAYVRGPDLVATYDESPPAQLRTQSYWRIVSPAEFAADDASAVLAAFDLILSVNTSVLDNNPQSRVSSKMAAIETVFELVANAAGNLEFQEVDLAKSGSLAGRIDCTSGTGCFLARIGSSEFSFVQMVHPADFGGATLDGNLKRLAIAHQLFQQRLEKGVILRARVRAAVLHRHNDLSTAVAAYRRFANAGPPLTV